MRTRSIAVVASAMALHVVACHSPAALRAAERGDLGTLRVEIDAGERSARLSLSTAAELARAVAFREVTSASREDAVAIVRDVRACAPELDDALEYVMKTLDDAGAEAAMARLDAGRLSAGDVRDFASSPKDAWRAVGARGLTRGRDAEARRRALLDPSPAVRRASLRAMLDADVAAADLPSLLEAARVDPDPLVRTDALRGIVRLGRAGTPVASELSDLYPRADDGLREDIGAAWAAPGIFELGGRERLRILLASEEGPGAISAAAAILREPHGQDGEIDRDARIELARVIAAGPRRNRLHAIAVAPLSAPSDRREAAFDLTAALEEASRDADADVLLSALGRLASPSAPGATRGAAISRLEVVAARSVERPLLASRARQLLAAAGDARAQSWIEGDLRSTDPGVSLAAVGALVTLGRASRAAPILADPDPSVRAEGACALIVAARVGRGI